MVYQQSLGFSEVLIQGEINPQYDGMVTNVNIFSESEDLEVEKLIADICILNGNYIAWSDFRNYDLFGLATHYNTSMESVCGPKRYEFVFKRFIVY